MITTGFTSAGITRNLRDLRFNLQEFSGGLGDLGTFIPLAVALSLSAGMDIAIILIFAGLFNIVTGVVFGLPIPVQPMKAIAAVAIADQLLPPEIAAAGMIVGALVLLLGITGMMEKAERLVPHAVIRGIQLGVGLKLAIKGVEYVANTPMMALDSIFTAVILALLVLLAARWRGFPSALVVFALGLIVVFAGSGVSATGEYDLSFSWPNLALVVPTPDQWSAGLFQGALAQAPLTLLNSVLAVCALSSDLFPGRGVSTKKMAISVGVMNLLSCWFGAMPMCHGSGGLAGQYHFGARTGGSVVMLGAVKLAVGLFFGAAAMSVLTQYPQSILGVLLFFAGLRLATPVRDQKSLGGLLVALATAVAIVAVNTTVGFLLGLVLALVYKWRSKNTDSPAKNH